MSKFKSFLYRFLYPACLIFTVFSLIFYIASASLSSDAETVSYAYMMIAAIVYSAVLALISLILRTDKPAAIKVLIHYLLVLATVIIILLIAGETFQFSSRVWIVVIYTAVYAAVAIPYLIVHYRKKRAESDTAEYKSKFKGK